MAVDYNKPTIDQTRKAAIDQIRENFQGLSAFIGSGYLPISGGTLTGSLIITAPANPSVFAVIPAAGQGAYVGFGIAPRQFAALDIYNPNGEALMVMQNGITGHALRFRVTPTVYAIEAKQMSLDGTDPGGPSYQSFVITMRNDAGTPFNALDLGRDGSARILGDFSCRNVNTQHNSGDLTQNMVIDCGFQRSITINNVVNLGPCSINFTNVPFGAVVRVAIRGVASEISAFKCNDVAVWWPNNAQVIPWVAMGNGPLQCIAISLFHFHPGYTMATYTPF
jgi:hypothetical protein